MATSEKWSDAAVKDLIFAILMSNNTDGSINVKANWDNVEVTMSQWGYTFTKSAMSQHWGKKILKEFKERHGTTGNAVGSGATAPEKAATPRKPRGPKKPKTPGTGGSSRSKKRAAADDDDDTSPEGHTVPDPIARAKTPRSATKKVKTEHTENGEHGEDSEDADGSEEALVKGEAEDGDFAV